MALTEFSTTLNKLQQQNATTFSRPSAIDFSSIENGHQILSNSVSNSSTNSNTSAFSVSSNLSDNGCPTLPKSFIDKTLSSFNDTKVFNDSGHQCLKPGLIKHPLLYNSHASNSNSTTNATAHSPLSPLAHFTHQHLHHLQQTNNRRLENHLINQQSHQFKPLCRTQNINNNFAKLNDNLHRKMEYTSSSSSTSSGCVSASSSSHHFPSNICSPSGSSSGPQTPLTPQSGYVQSPLAQSFTADSGLSLSFRSSQSINNNASSSTINNQTSIADLANDLSRFSQKLLNNKNLDKQDEKFELLSNPSTSNDESKSFASTKIKTNDNTIKKLDLLNNKKSNVHKPIEAKASLLNLPLNKKDTDNESLLSDYSKDLSTTSAANSNLSAINATSTTNLVSIGQQTSHSTITSKPSLPGASSSFFHYPNIYNPLRNSKNNTKNNKKLIRFMTVCAYVLSVSLVAILLSLYYLFIWNPYTKKKTNYYDVDYSAHPHVGSIIGSSPQSIHLTPNVKVNLNQTESKTIILPLAAESNQEPISIERFGGLTSLAGNTNSNSEELDSGSSIGGNSNNAAPSPNDALTTYEMRLSRLPVALALKGDKKLSTSTGQLSSKSSRNSDGGMDSEQSNYSNEQYQQSKLINLLKTNQATTRYKIDDKKLT